MFLSGATHCALAEESNLVSVFRATTGFEKNLERSFASLLLTVPNAVKLFEYRDEWRTLYLVKLSEHSYGMMEETGATGGGLTRRVVNAETGAQCLLEKKRVITGKFSYEFIDPSSGIRMPTTYVWSLDEWGLDGNQKGSLIFTYEFSDTKGKPQNSVSIAVDWEAGRVEGLKVVPWKNP